MSGSGGTFNLLHQLRFPSTRLHAGRGRPQLPSREAFIQYLAWKSSSVSSPVVASVTDRLSNLLFFICLSWCFFLCSLGLSRFFYLDYRCSIPNFSGMVCQDMRLLLWLEFHGSFIEKCLFMPVSFIFSFEIWLFQS